MTPLRGIREGGVALLHIEGQLLQTQCRHSLPVRRDALSTLALVILWRRPSRIRHLVGLCNVRLRPRHKAWIAGRSNSYPWPVVVVRLFCLFPPSGPSWGSCPPPPENPPSFPPAPSHHRRAQSPSDRVGGWRERRAAKCSSRQLPRGEATLTVGALPPPTTTLLLLLRALLKPTSRQQRGAAAALTGALLECWEAPPSSSRQSLPLAAAASVFGGRRRGGDRRPQQHRQPRPLTCRARTAVAPAHVETHMRA